MVSGSLAPLVSGKNITKIEAKMFTDPTIKMGNDIQYTPNISSKNPTIEY